MDAQLPTLAERLRSRREELGLSQAQVARELDVARTAYRLWELEAAKPAPDRWRLVARWLGVSMTTLLIAEGLISDDEGEAQDAAAERFVRQTGETSDLVTERETGDFFEQAESFLDHSLARGLISPDEARQFRRTFRRVQDAMGPPQATEGSGGDD